MSTVNAVVVTKVSSSQAQSFDDIINSKVATLLRDAKLRFDWGTNGGSQKKRVWIIKSIDF